MTATSSHTVRWGFSFSDNGITIDTKTKGLKNATLCGVTTYQFQYSNIQTNIISNHKIDAKT